MPAKKKSEKRIKKEAYWARLQAIVAKYKNCLFVNADNVSSKQICFLRQKLRAIDAVMIMGKNTLMKACLTEANRKPDPSDPDYAERKDSWKPNPNIEKIMLMLRGNINLIFSNGDLSEVKAVLDKEVRPSPARPGMIAPDDVIIQPGPTGLDPKQTSVFQTFQIQTKIVKAQIDIVAAKQVVFKDQKIGTTEAALLDKLKIYPFFYKMEVVKVLQDGSVFDAKVLDLSLDSILAKFKAGIKKQAELSLGAAYPTSASAPHSIGNAFKNLVAVSAMSGYEFPQATALLQAAKNAPAAGAAPTKAAAEAAAPVEEKKEEVEDVDMGGLFGDDEDDY
jgi:large subunit ribosomal protein LP0